ncbi:MAG: cohesin domain-containing protein [Salinivenus sp.]
MPKLFALLLVLSVLGTVPTQAQGTLRLPDTTLATTDAAAVPVGAEGLSGSDIFSWQFEVRYDPAVLDTVTVEAQGTLAEGRRMSANTTRRGRLSVAVAGTAPVEPGSPLLILRVHPAAPGRTPLAWESAQFNEGTPEARTVDGRVTVVPSDTTDAPQ